MYVSKLADMEFMAALKKEDPKRYEALIKNIRRDNPSGSLSEEQALTNFLLGMPTSQFQFEVIAGKPILPVTIVFDANAADRNNLRIRQKQARAMKALLRTQKSVPLAA